MVHVFRLSVKVMLGKDTNYVNVYMKWKKDTNFDTIESVNKSIELKPLISLKNLIANLPNGCIRISDVS